MGDCCCNQNPQGGSCCYKMVAVSTPVSLLVGDANSCAGKLVAPETTSVAMWIDNRIVWSDGSSLRPICLGLQEASEIDVVIGQTAGGCLTELIAPSTNSLLFYSDSGTWADGSEANPICLTELQTITDLSDMKYMIGLNDSGCLVKIAITSNDITTCEGPVLTVPVTAVT